MEGLYCLSGLPLVMLNQGGAFYTSTSPTVITYPVTFSDHPTFSVTNTGQTGIYNVMVHFNQAEVSWMTVPTTMAVWFITIGH